MCEIMGIKFQTNIWNSSILLDNDTINKLLISPDTGAISVKQEIIDDLVNLQTKKPIFVSVNGSFIEVFEIVRKLCMLSLNILIEWDLTMNSIVPTDFEIKSLRDSCAFPIGIKIDYFVNDIYLLDSADFVVVYNEDMVKDIIYHSNIPIIISCSISTEDEAEKLFSLGVIGIALEDNFDLIYSLNMKKNYLSILKSIDIIENNEINIKKLMLNPSEWNKIIYYAIQKLSYLSFKYISYTQNGFPWASIIASQMGKPLLKNNELCKSTDTCVIIDEILNSEASFIDISSKLGMNTIYFCIFNKNNIYKIQNKFVHYIFNFEDISRPIQPKIVKYNKKFQKLRNIIRKKNSRICLSIDINNQDVLTIIKNAGPHICMIRINSDNIPLGIGLELLTLSIQYDFLILLDRKFSDIGEKSMIKQYEYYLSKLPFDFVTVDEITDKKSIKELSKFTNIFFMASNNMFYFDKIICISEEYGCGLICKEKIHTGLVCGIQKENIMLIY
jgi:hypothetical protein